MTQVTCYSFSSIGVDRSKEAMNSECGFPSRVSRGRNTACLLGSLQEEALGPRRDELVQTDALALAVKPHLVHATVLGYAVVCGVRATYVLGVQVQHCNRNFRLDQMTAQNVSWSYRNDSRHD